MIHGESSKNHTGGRPVSESLQHLAHMYKTKEESDAYTALKLYLGKLHRSCEALFQTPKRNWKPTDSIWYENRPLRVNKLADMMKSISSAAGLSKIYTNHCVRATSITLWSNAGLTNRHIMSISGHRNEQSLKHYNSRPSTSQLKRCSNVLSEALGDDLHDQHPVQRRQLSGTMTKSSFSTGTTSEVTSKSTSTSSFTSHTSTNVQVQDLPNFGSFFNNCHDGHVNINIQR